jgi:hypothetical protein
LRWGAAKRVESFGVGEHADGNLVETPTERVDVDALA